MDIVVVPLLFVLKIVVDFAIWVIIADVVISWLMVANIFNLNNRFIAALIDSVARLSAFITAPIREWIPLSIGMLDLSPFVAMLILTYLDMAISRLLLRFV